MFIYLALYLSILILGLCYESINSKSFSNRINKKLPSYFFIVPSFIALFIISAFRGDFNSDYNNYRFLFEKANRYDFTYAMQSTDLEAGYLILSRLVGSFTSNDLFLFITVSFIILACYFSQFTNKYTPYIWLSVLMFATIGSYLASFNIMRQVLAAAIIFAGSRFLYERNMVKYFLVVLLASFFHVTSLIMVVFYFILNIRFNKRNATLLIFIALFLILFLDNIINFVQVNYYTTYTATAYGMTGASFNIAILPIALMIFSLFNINKLDLNNNVQRIWLNAVIFYAIFSALGVQVFMVERLTHFFASYALLLIPLLFSLIKPKELRFISIMILVFLLISYNFIVFSGTDYDPYYFIWSTR